jgi:hypothetical protein
VAEDVVVVAVVEAPPLPERPEQALPRRRDVVAVDAAVAAEAAEERRLKTGLAW